jgi:ADP-heptose:LPS heptosyltransferase
MRRYNNVISVPHIKHSMADELSLLSHCDLMLTMDSAWMHLASLVGLPVVSVWGATHPFAGFMGWKQSAGNAVQVDLPCRPCSVYGNKPCMRGDYACLNLITPEQIVEKIEQNNARNKTE